MENANDNRTIRLQLFRFHSALERELGVGLALDCINGGHPCARPGSDTSEGGARF